MVVLLKKCSYSLWILCVFKMIVHNNGLICGHCGNLTGA